MSRGLGKVQQEALRIINAADRKLDTFEVAREIFRPNEEGEVTLTAAQLNSAHWALRALAKRQAIHAHGCNSLGRMDWCSDAVKRQIDERVAEVMASIQLAKFVGAARLKERLERALSPK
jgi:hypothetical protein